MSDQYYTIRIPRLEGYKTLAVNGLTVVAGVVALWKPQWIMPDPATFGLAYDQLTGAVVALLAAVNMMLRLMTRAPVASPLNVLGMEAKPDPAQAAQAFGAGVAHGLASVQPAPVSAADAVCAYPDCRCSHDQLCAVGLRHQLEDALSRRYAAPPVEDLDSLRQTLRDYARPMLAEAREAQCAPVAHEARHAMAVTGDRLAVTAAFLAMLVAPSAFMASWGILGAL